MNIGLIILLVIMVIFIIGFMYIEPILMKHKVKNDNEYGSARFSTDREIKKNFKKESIYHIKEAGFPVSFSKNLKCIYFDRETPHYVYLGSTGSGKSVTAVITTCTFIAKAKNSTGIIWHLISPDGTEDYQDEEMSSVFTSLELEGLGSERLKIKVIPLLTMKNH